MSAHHLTYTFFNNSQAELITMSMIFFTERVFTTVLFYATTRWGVFQLMKAEPLRVLHYTREEKAWVPHLVLGVRAVIVL